MSRGTKDIGLIMLTLQGVREVLLRHGEHLSVAQIDEVMRQLDRRSPAAVRQERYRHNRRARDASVTLSVTVGDAQGDAESDASVTPPALPRNLQERSLFSEVSEEESPSSESSSSSEALPKIKPSSVTNVRARDASVTPHVTPKTTVAWNAYAVAYRRRYGRDPVRNKKVNGQLAHFVERIPVENQVATVTHYVRSNNARYVQAGHSIGCLLSDAEKLCTEALTGRTGTATAAQRADRTADRGDQYGEMFERLAARDAARVTGGNHG